MTENRRKMTRDMKRHTPSAVPMFENSLHGKHEH